jgi:oligopeptidase B
MRILATIVMAMTLLNLSGSAGEPRPPVARTIPRELTAHGQIRQDPYYWLRERDDPEVIRYLEAENAYLEAMMADTDELQETLFAEITDRIEPDDASVPVFSRGYWYYTRHVEDGEYALHCRREGSLEAPEQVMLDGNALAAGEPFFALHGVRVSSDNRTVAYAVDTVGRRRYTWRFRDLESGADYPERIADMTPSGVWAEDGRSFLYVRQDPQTLRSYQVWRHVLGTAPDADVLVFEETDETFNVRVSKTKSRRYLLIHSSQTVSDEVRLIEAEQPAGDWRVFQPRERGLEYSVDHLEDRFVVRTNLEAENFRLVTCGLDRTGKEAWRDLIPHDPRTLVESFELYREFLVVEERRGGLTRLRVRPWRADDEQEHEIDFGEATYAAWIIGSPELDTTVLRYGFSSLTTPRSVIDYDLAARTRVVRKQDRVLGDFDPARYEAEYLRATAADGTEVPISLVYRRDRFVRGENPCLLYGYGSYGLSSEASFRISRLSLLDRGFVFAIAHVRGGQELGRSWYEDGKLLRKRNTFTDFIACGEHLVAAGYADPGRLYAMGGSAGGLLVGAVMNLAPELWDGVVAAVPFVDVVTTMLDDSIPLTTAEYDEWGDPHQQVYYDYMLSYSPYDQVQARDYPALLVTTGLHDSQVQYWEPAKWVARLRARKTDENLLLLHTDLTAGHGGASGRFRRHRETALQYAFLLKLAGLADGDRADKAHADPPRED